MAASISAFMNDVVVPWCREQKIEVTRSRAYKKNDQAFVEQKNGAVVRRLVGYGRFDGVETARVMARLYAAARLHVNFFTARSVHREHLRTCAGDRSVAVPCRRLCGASPHTAAVGLSGSPQRRQRPYRVFAMPTRRRRQFVQDAPLLAPSCRPVALRHRPYRLAPRAHADPSRHRRHRPDSVTPPQSSAQDLR
jgi:hypothetical protein